MLSVNDRKKLSRELNNRFLERTEIRPNRIVFHESEEMRQLLGVGTLLKEQKVIDNRRKTSQESLTTSLAISMNSGRATASEPPDNTQGRGSNMGVKS